MTTDYPTWIVQTLAGNKEVVVGNLEVIGDALVRIFQDENRTVFVAALMNIEFVVQDEEAEE